VIDKVQTLWPEIALFITTCVVMVLGLSRDRTTRRLVGVVSGLGLVAALVLAILTSKQTMCPLPGLATYGKAVIAAVGLLLLLLAQGTVDREYEESVVKGAAFDPLKSNRAEFASFFLFSLTGLMLCVSATDLIWLFLALELTSLPTYVMVAISSKKNRSLEAGVKYFFLGALGAAIFLYGFVMLYGSTGTTSLTGIQAVLGQQMAHSGGINTLATLGLVLSVLGVCFKIAAVPMHFYTADVYQGAAATVSAFLAFVPKTAGFVAIMLICSAAGWRFGESGHDLPAELGATLAVIAVLTMTVGNILALLQSSIKRILAYSSIAHSGYMLVGVIAGPGTPEGGFFSNGIAAVLFYLLCYGVMNVGAFAVVAALERRKANGDHDEVESVNDLFGLCQTRPVFGWMMVLCALGLAGIPPLLGFWAKLPLFTAGISSGHIPLVIVLGLNSAIAAYYYLRLAGPPYLEKPDPLAGLGAGPVEETPFASRVLAGLLSAAGVVALVAALPFLMDASKRAAAYTQPAMATSTSAQVATPDAAEHKVP
jgi:NADH-quinone oxidoreductase subunit N